ncbi:MAG: MerR family DNA-binding protein [Betaproteobacteria bacterium]|nr:MerR family DNA-binding protein [Betaproteobacteria bacterium]
MTAELTIGKLAEVGGLLTLDEACACAQTRTLAARKVALIEQKIADLAAMRKVLARLVKQCDQGDGGAACPIIDVLATDRGRGLMFRKGQCLEQS